MRVKAPHDFLLDALVLPDPQAGDAWRRWRATTDLDRLDTPSFHLLPALAGRLQHWAAEDPQRAILMGICRRSWSQNQLCRRAVAESLEILREAGIERVAAMGPVLSGALYWPAGTIRPVLKADSLVSPAQVCPAIEALLKAGWTTPNGKPDCRGNAFFFAPAVGLRSPSGGDIRLNWRSLPNTDFSLWRPPLPVIEPLPPGSIARYGVPAEHSLVVALGGSQSDGLDWRCDALMICRQARPRWEVMAPLLRWRSLARQRLEELSREWEVDVPSEVTKPAWTSGMERLLSESLRRHRSR